MTGFEGEIVWDTSMPNGQPRRSLDASRAEELFGFRAADAAPRRARADGRLVPGAAHRRMRLAERLDGFSSGRDLLIAGAIVLQWLTTLVVALRADSVDVGAGAMLERHPARPARARLCVSDRGERRRRRARRLDAAGLGRVPWLAPAFTLTKYDATLRDDVLPLVLGLTGDAGYAEGVAILAALALLIMRTRVSDGCRAR